VAAGKYEVKIDGTSFGEKYVVVEVAHIKRSDTGNNCEGATINVPLGAPLQLQPIPNPDTPGWPDNNPVWDSTEFISPVTHTVDTSVAGSHQFTVNCGYSNKSVTVNVIKVEIEINRTPVQNDDYVGLDGTTPCRAKLSSPLSEAITVWLTNKPGAIPGKSLMPITLALSKDGAWVNFDISGAEESKTVNDAAIEAHFESEEGPQVGSEDLTVVKVDMTVPTRIPPRVNTAIPTTIQPVGITVTFEVKNTGGVNGNAIFAGGTNTLAGTGSLNLTTPTAPAGASDPAQTTPGHAGNLVVAAKIGTTELARSTGFTVAAYPVNYHQTVGNAAAGAVLHFEYAWDSDSGNVADLDQVQVGEHVQYPAAGFPNPPFVGWNLANPTVLNVPGVDGGLQDNHGNLAMTAGPAANVDGTQNYRFHCNRTMPAGNANALAWGNVLLGPIAIQRWVEFIFPAGIWQYRILKSGVTATRPVP
jgi:hypothetical protein